MLTLEKIKSDQQILFLTAYTCPFVGLIPEIKNVTELQRIMYLLSSNVQEGLISFTNFVETVV